MTPPKTATQLVEEWHAEWLHAPKPHWGDKITWATADEIARRVDIAQAPKPESCLRSGDAAKDEAYCTLQAGHEGACTVVRY